MVEGIYIYTYMYISNNGARILTGKYEERERDGGVESI